VNKSAKKANDGGEDHRNKCECWQSILLAIGCTFHVYYFQKKEADFSIPCCFGSSRQELKSCPHARPRHD